MAQVREIEFRAQTVYDGKWVYGFPMHYANPHYDKWTIREPTGLECDVEEETLGQYTGIRDSKGTRIYEGDVLMIEGIKNNRYCKVWWNPDKFTFYIGHSPMDAYLRKDDNLCEFCVVGNIYDNPELIQEIA